MDFSTFEHFQQSLKPGNVHGFVQAVVQGLRDQRVIDVYLGASGSGAE